MMSLLYNNIIIILILIFCTYNVYGRIESTTISSDDRSFIHLETFGFEPGGAIEFKINKFLLWVSRNDMAYYQNKEKGNEFNIKFIAHKSNNDVSDTNFHGCFHESETYKNAVKDNSITEWNIPDRKQWDGSTEYKLNIEEPGYYHLLFSNCEPRSGVSFELHLTEYNVDSNGNRYYLSAGEKNLPLFYFAICALFIILLIVWVKILLAERPYILPIHYVMTAVLICKILTMLTESVLKHYLKATGTAHGWNVIYYFIYFIKSMSMMSAVVLIGTGWSYMKPFLTERDKQIFLVVLVITVIVDIATVVVNETMPGASEWLTWREVLTFLNMICYCILLFPIVWSIWHLKESAGTDGTAAKNLERLKKFRKFYLLLVGYIYWTRIVVFMVEATLAFEYTWIGNVCEELAAVVFYAITGYLFRPQPQNAYLHLKDDEDENEISTALELDDV